MTDSQMTASTTNDDSVLTGGDAGAAAPDWRPESYKDKFTEFKGPEDLFKGYEGLVSKLGTNPIVKPKEGASEEEVNAYKDTLYKELGRPENVDGYTINTPDAIKEVIDGGKLDQFKELALKAGMTPDQVAQVTEWYFGDVSGQLEGFQAAQEEAMTKAETELKEAWKGDYDKNVGLAQNFLKAYVGEDNPDYSFFEEHGNDPRLIRAMHSLTTKLKGEDSMDASEGAIGKTPLSPADRQMKLAEIMGSEEFNNPMHPRHSEKVAEMNALYQS